VLTFALVAAAPWIVIPLIALWRARGDPSLDNESPEDTNEAPKVSVVIPARNEGANIAACVQSILMSRYPALEVIVVDDHSVDDTLAIARVMAGFDDRVTALEAPPLPDGWFGKQWACHRGADHASGELLCFTDADTRHGHDRERSWLPGDAHVLGATHSAAGVRDVVDALRRRARSE